MAPTMTMPGRHDSRICKPSAGHRSTIYRTPSQALARRR
jgi:hypothetical protein